MNQELGSLGLDKLDLVAEEGIRYVTALQLYKSQGFGILIIADILSMKQRQIKMSFSKVKSSKLTEDLKDFSVYELAVECANPSPEGYSDPSLDSGLNSYLKNLLIRVVETTSTTFFRSTPEPPSNLRATHTILVISEDEIQSSGKSETTDLQRN